MEISTVVLLQNSFDFQESSSVQLDISFLEKEPVPSCLRPVSAGFPACSIDSWRNREEM